MIDTYNEPNLAYCGTAGGWLITYNNAYWDAYTLIYAGLVFNPVA